MAGEELPTQDDFDPWHGHPDARWANGVFGGLTIPQAIQKYQERPDLYWEAFMFMGSKAFAYYFPVIDYFVHSVPNLTYDDDDWEDPHGWILAHSIKGQFDRPGNGEVKHLARRVIELAKFVQDNIHRFEPDRYGHAKESVSEAWATLMQIVQSCHNPPPSPTHT